MKTFIKIIFGSCLGVLLAIGAVALILTFVGSSFSNKESVKDNSILRIDLSEQMPDKTNNTESDPYSFENNNFVGTVDAVKLIEHAKTDVKIKGIYINPSSLSVGQTGLKSIHDAILDFKSSGKFVIAYGESLTQGGFYLSSSADKIILNPLGELSFKGLALNSIYFKNLMDELKVKMNIFYVGKFKSATEPFRQDHMSNENRLQLKEFLNDMFDQIIQDIASDRKIDPVELRRYADELAVQNPEDALKYRLIDQIGYEDEVFDEIRSILKLKEKDKLNFISLNSYYDKTTLSKDYKETNKIAVVYAEGEINDSDESDGKVGGKAYVQILRKIRMDDQVKAVVLRVNSPGGSAYASEQMWREVELLKKAGKKVVVSMGDYAASGGYYISCNADSIFASANTITGSIGVFGIVPYLGDFFKSKLYITQDSVKTGPNAFGLNTSYELNPTEQAAVQKSVEQIYNLFITHVADGRKLPKSTVDSLAQGRIYSGQDALSIGLVDRIGGLEEAIQSASKLAKTPKYRVIEYPESKPPFEKLLDELMGKNKDNDLVSAKVKKELKQTVPGYFELKNILSGNKYQARIPFVIQQN